MSHDVDALYDAYVETWRAAHKAHTCCACKETIAAGHRYCYVSVVFDGNARAYKRCAKCQALHEHLRGLCHDGDRWPDEQLACGQDYVEEWGPLPDEIAALAFMSQDEAQSIAKTGRSAVVLR